jgi:predicted flavoprotein YhiN
MQSYDVVVLGAGAAGMMCAFEAGKRGRTVLLLDHGDKVGRKILISGGGRCNFTNIHARAENFLSGNPHFAKSALAGFTPKDFIALVEKHGIKYHEKTLGQLFCDDSARLIVAMLEKECVEAGVETRCGVTVGAVRTQNTGVSAPQRAKTARRGPRSPLPSVGRDDRFIVSTSLGEIQCDAVVVATGGLSIPKMGATAFGYELAKQYGHNVIEPRAGLVPLVFGAEDRERWCDLAGVAFEVVARAENSHPQEQRSLTQSARRKGAKAAEFRERLLVTHRGVSGPAVLQASSYWRPGGEVTFDCAPGVSVFRPLMETTAGRDWNSAYAALRAVLPTRMAERWVRVRASASAGDWTNAGIARLEHDIHAWTVRPDGSEGFAKAEVTVGGVDTNELDAQTMESKRVKGMYFIGEVVDVTGWLGGYNFQWAWASAVAAAKRLGLREGLIKCR